MRSVPTARCAAILLVALAARAASGAKLDKAAGPAPAARVLTAPLGYYPPSGFYLMGRASSVSLDFLDDDHLLFTFRVPGLLRRLPECKPDDEDQVIRALVLRLPDGAVERSAEWRMHDRGQYLWALGSGNFLLRQRDTLLLADSTLEPRPYLESPAPIRLVKLSPDRRLLLVESDLEKHTEDQHRRLAEAADAEGLSPPREDVRLSILRVEDGAVVARSRALNPTDLPLIDNGFLEALSGQGDHWMLRYQPFHGEPSAVADVESSCHPDENPVSDKAFLVNLCPGGGGDRLFQAISLAGKTLWSYKWDSHFIWPTKAVSENGERLAYSALRVARPLSAIDPFDESEIQGQRVEVFDVQSGRLALTELATPALSAGQNYALSPDGKRFAVLRENAVEIYDLPPPAPTPAARGKAQ